MAKGTLTTVAQFLGVSVQFLVSLGWTSIAALVSTGSRPHPKWTYRQTMVVKLLTFVLKAGGLLHPKTPLSLKPGKEGSRFVVVQPAPEQLYKGPANDNEVKPIPVGGTWTPAAPTAEEISSSKDGVVVLHFHGGAYVLMTGRDNDLGYFLGSLVAHSSCVSHVFALQFRLASNPGGKFPAALQDAISAYWYLVDTLKLPPSRIVISGDSAGGNLVMGLLRYLSEHGNKSISSGADSSALDPMGLPLPTACLAWSPWVNLHSATDKDAIRKSPNFKTDILNQELIEWGAFALLGPSEQNHDKLKEPYISPVLSPFKSEVPLWVHTCSGEILFFDDVALEEGMRKAGTVTELEILEGASHDAVAFGDVLGLDKEAKHAMIQASSFIQKHLV